MRLYVVWAETALCEVSVFCFIAGTGGSRRAALGRGIARRAEWRGWNKLTMARPSDDGAAEAYIDEAATII